MSSSLTIRMATLEDAEALLQIYAPYVTSTAITFEYTVPTVEQFKERMALTLQRYPFLVVLQDDIICGYAYASVFKPRVAYDRAVETTIYLKDTSRGTGIGRQLYEALESLLRKQNVINLYACITSAAPSYVDAASELFHSKLGYTKVAHFSNCGYKFDQWFDVIWMEKFLKEHVDCPAPFIPINQLDII